ncbi:hypothetical protein AB432_020535 [Brevibacillus brevis]|uniref:Uncharacterized protein n=1 Tax=Brevibacillus brevis TaxID=1393 RepID=A0A2Z4MLN9_BREBE|nr:acyltransferase domain-containing protein [Brevibacillus brevis]AWX57291.1 hypothetical protein AB432_020535 [Brevibacillus brevis]
MEKPVVFLFSGQGSQYDQRGKDLFDQNPVFRKWMLRLDEKVHSIGTPEVAAVAFMLGADYLPLACMARLCQS